MHFVVRGSYTDKTIGEVAINELLSLLIGALFSVVAAVQVLSGTLAFVVYPLVYKLCLERGWHPGAPFWLMALLYLLTTPFLM